MKRIRPSSLLPFLLLLKYSIYMEGVLIKTPLDAEDESFKANTQIVQDIFKAPNDETISQNIDQQSVYESSWWSTPGIRCHKVIHMIINYSDQTENPLYVCEHHPNDANGVMGTRSPLTNIPDSFDHQRDIAMLGGMDSLYIPGAVRVNGKIHLPSENDTNLPLTWFYGEPISTDNIVPNIQNKRSLEVSQEVTRTVLVVRIRANSISPGPTPNEIINAVFGTHGDTESFVNQYRSCSANKFILTPTTEATTSFGLPIKNGLLEVDIGTTDDLDVFTITSAAKAKIGDISLFDHLLYAVPTGTTTESRGTHWYAFADLPGNESYYGSNGSVNVSQGAIAILDKAALVHEVGHNIGMRHSGESSDQYGDFTCQMGVSGNHLSRRCFNGAKFAELEWYPERVQTVDPISTSFSGKIVGIHDLNSGSLSQTYSLVVVVANPAAQNISKLFISYNVKEGITEGTGEYANEVIIVGATPGTNSWSQSRLISHLTTGESYTVSNYKGDRDLIIHVPSSGMDGSINYASLIVHLTSSKCSVSSECNDLDSCTTDVCTTGSNQCSYNAVPSCCGNGICEPHSGETCATCPNDCTVRNEDCEVLVTNVSNWWATTSYSGFVFDIKGLTDLHVLSITIYSYNNVENTGVIYASIYAKPSTWYWSEKNQSQWVRLTNSIQVVGEDTRVAFANNRKVYKYEVPLKTVWFVGSSKIQSFYIFARSSSDIIVHAGTGSSIKTIDAQNSDVVSYQGTIVKYPPFSDSSLTIRKRKGDITYVLGGIPCSSLTECNDYNECTIDTCSSGICSFTPIANCCGNQLCETRETCLSCPNDCVFSTHCNEIDSVASSWNYSDGIQGFMIDVKALTDINVQSITFYAFNTDASNGIIQVNVYTKVNTWLGSETTLSAWKLITDSEEIIGESTGYNFPGQTIFTYEVALTTPQNISSLKVRAFYVSAVTTNNIIVYGSSGNSASNLDSFNSDLKTYEIGISSLPFFSYTQVNRKRFNGVLLYGYGKYNDGISDSLHPSTSPSSQPSTIPSSQPSTIQSYLPPATTPTCQTKSPTDSCPSTPTSEQKSNVPSVRSLNNNDIRFAIIEYLSDRNNEKYASISTWDISNVTDMSGLFYDNSNFNSDISKWDTSNVTNMHNMFAGASSFNTVISKWDTSNVTSMNNMFAGATSFNINISNWDISKLTKMKEMFYGATSFHQHLCWEISQKNSQNMFKNSYGSIGGCSSPQVTVTRQTSHRIK